MQSTDASLEVLIVGGHVVRADLVVETVAGAAHRSHYVIAGPELGDVGANLFHLPEALVPNHQELIAVGSSPVFGGVDLLVRPIHTHFEDADQHASSVGHVVYVGLL